jgi:ferric-dicitrate binding protein FerR (iron transport regulator)
MSDGLAEAQEELRGEVALMAERFEGLERTLRKLAGQQSAARTELEQRQTQLLENLSVEQRRNGRIVAVFIGVALLLAIAGLLTALLK